MTSSDSPGGVGSPAWGQTSTAPGTAASYSSTGSAGAATNTEATNRAATNTGSKVNADAPTGTVPATSHQANLATSHQSNSTTDPHGGAAVPRVTRAATRARGPRRASLQLRHVNPWTVLKFSCVLAIALFFVWLIVVGVLFGVLDAAGVIGKINDAYTTLKGGGANPPVTATLVFGSAAIIGVVNIILFIALSTIGSVIYNLCADLVGGIEVTLSER